MTSTSKVSKKCSDCENLPQDGCELNYCTECGKEFCSDCWHGYHDGVGDEVCCICAETIDGHEPD